MYTRYSRLDDQELLSLAYMSVSVEDEMAFELLQRLEMKIIHDTRAEWAMDEEVEDANA